MFVISRIEQYKFTDAAAVFAESERKLARYDNPDWNPEKARDNVHLVEPIFDGSLETHILSKKQQFKCRLSVDPSLPLNKQTNCFCQALFTASPEVFQSLTRAETDQFFEDCLTFFSVKFESVEIISAVQHMDETTPHLHINFLPLIAKRNSKGTMKTVFSTSALFDGKDFFAKYQDEFYEYMKERYPDLPLVRKGEEKQEHLTVKEYKQVQANIEKAKDELELIQEAKKEAKQSNTPLIDAKIANADLRRENEKLKKDLDYYQRLTDYFFNQFPKLKAIADIFRKQWVKFVRDRGR